MYQHFKYPETSEDTGPESIHAMLFISSYDTHLKIKPYQIQNNKPKWIIPCTPFHLSALSQ
jgi:hypothetical protein